MSYWMKQTSSQFYIPKEKIESAARALSELFYVGVKEGWVTEIDCLRDEDFDDLMHDVCWSVYFDDQGNCDRIAFVGPQWRGDEEKVLGAIAQFVADGSYIQMRGEQDKIWRWKFADGKCVKVYPRWE